MCIAPPFGSLWETDSPGTGEVAHSARRGALSAKLTEGESLIIVQSFGQRLCSLPHPLRGSPLAEGAIPHPMKGP